MCVVFFQLFLDDAAKEINKQNERRSTRLSEFMHLHNNDEVIYQVPDINLDDFDELTSDECYSSSEYTPYSLKKINSDFDTSESDNNNTPTHLYSKKNIKNVKTVVEQKSVSPLELNVQRVKRNPKNPKKIIKDKRVYCIFCESLETNFPRHIERKHALEYEVRALILLPKKSKERIKQLEMLKNKGNFFYNKNVIEKKCGSLIVGRRPKDSDDINVDDYLPCKNCFKFFLKNKMFRHTSKCKFIDNLQTNPDVPKRRNRKMQCAMLLQNTSDLDNLSTEVFCNMKMDNVSLTAQQDKLICSFGARLLQNHREAHLKTYVSQRMRQLSKLLLILRKLNSELQNLQDFLVPQHYKTIVSAAKELSGYNEEANTYYHPSIALKLGHSILQCADIVESQLIIQNASEDKIQQVKHFTTVFHKEWKFSISSNACQDMSKKKFNKVMSLPDAKDITLLNNFLSNQLQKVMNQIEQQKVINQQTYKILCQTLLSQIILLNRRRSGEVERIKIQDYLNRDKNKVQEEISKSLTAIEYKLSTSLVRFEIRGKRGRGVPVLLTPQMKISLDTILNIRDRCNVFKQNENIFAIPFTAVGVYRGSECMNKFANACGSSNPDLLTSTKLRKHVATMSQLLNLTTNDREQLANFMGHDLSIHNQYYRLPDNTLQLSRVSKILLAVESGNLHELKGKTLDEFDSIVPTGHDNSSSDEDDTGKVKF